MLQVIKLLTMSKQKTKPDPLAECDNWLDTEETKEPIRSKWRDLDVKKVGRPKNIKGPEELLEHFKAYVTEVDENPFLKQEVIKGGAMAGSIVEVPTIRPYTWAGFSSYLRTNGILAKIEDYKANTNESYTEFSDIIAYMGEAMHSQKFEGAATGAFKENLIARELGLADKSTQTIKTEQPLFGEE